MQKIKNKIIILFLLLTFYLFSSKENFEIKEISNKYFYQEKEINLEIDNKKIGFIFYIKLPFSVYILHSFFIYSDYRNKGYGTSLLKFTCNLIESEKGKKIYIQPGPFDLFDKEFKDITDKELKNKKIKLLTKLYNKLGFQSSSSLLKKFISVIYRISFIDQDSKYLLVKCN